uniref:PD-(D/E)XK endonuclease-like domain-containing protein n=1 Tax=Globisporangium ultimum (strain ATCC 200006 / CBS 805.95 / DAOM BR144) TaxID=431595 RepID=K3X309_GLOUD
MLRGRRLQRCLYAAALEPLQVHTSDHRGHWHASSVDTKYKSICAAERVKWLVDGNCDAHRKVLAFSAETNDQSRLRRYVDEHMAFHELERRGHGVFGMMQWCQEALEETGNEKRVFPRGRMAAFLTHHLDEMPLDLLQRSMTSPLTARKAVLDLLQLFQLLESEGISPSAYSSNAANTEDPKQIELARAYETYRELLAKHRITSWDGLVLDTLELTGANAQRHTEFADAVLRGYTDIVVDDLHAMTPAMVKLIGSLCAHSNIRSSASFSRILLPGDECPRALLLNKVLNEHNAVVNVESMVLNGEQTVESSRAQGIREIAQRLLGPHGKKDSVAAQSTPLVKCFTFDTAANEELALAKRIKEKLAGTPAEDIAVLCPTHVDAQRLTQSLQSQGIAPGVNAVYSLLVALCFPSDSRHLYNVLRSDFFDLSPEVLSKLMEKEFKTQADLFEVLEKFVATKGQSYYVQTDQVADAIANGQVEAELQTATKFVGIITRLRSECHKKPTQELVQTFLEETGRLESLLEPSSPSEEQEVIALADFLRELEVAQNVVQSAHAPFVVPYLQQLRESQVSASYQASQSPVEVPNPASGQGIVVLPLTQRNVQSLDASVLFMASMRDTKFPGRMRRLTMPLPYKLLSEPYPIQTRGGFLEQSEKLAFEALASAKEEVIISYASIATGPGHSAKAKQESVSRVFLPIWEECSSVASERSMGGGFASSKSSRSDQPPGSNDPNELNSSKADRLASDSIKYEPSHLSYTQISEYLRCPQRYFLGRVMKLPTEASAAMMYGRALHEAVASFASDLQKQKKSAGNEATGFDEEVIQEARERAHEVFAESWETEGVFASTEQEQYLFEQGKKALEVFCSQHADRNVLHVEFPFEVYVPEAKVHLRGVWDRIDHTAKGPIIKEFKSNMSGSERNVSKLAADSLQLKLYMYAFQSVFGNTPRGAVLEMIGDENNSAPHGQDQVGYIPFTPEATNEALEAIQSVAAGLREGDFTPKPSYMECAFCPFASSVCRAGNEAARV